MKFLRNFFILSLIYLSAGCNTGYEEPDSAIEAGRQFISAIYNGNFKRAGQLITEDKGNREMLKDQIEKDFRSRNSFAKDSLSKSSIQINKISAIDTLTTIIEFTNAYYRKEGILLVKKVDGYWRVKIEKLK